MKVSVSVRLRVRKVSDRRIQLRNHYKKGEREDELRFSLCKIDSYNYSKGVQ